MSKTEPTYGEVVAQMRAERHEREAAERRDQLEREFAELAAQRDEAAQREDLDDFNYIDSQIEDIEREYARVAPAQPQVPAFTDVETEVIGRYAPSQYSQSSWLMRSKYGGSISNEEAVKTGATYAQHRFVQERAARGLPTTAEDLTAYRNSPAYREAVEVFTPPEANGLPTPDSIVEDIKRTSRYAGKDFEKKYNQGVRQMDKLGKRGEYDR